MVRRPGHLMAAHCVRRICGGRAGPLDGGGRGRRACPRDPDGRRLRSGVLARRPHHLRGHRRGIDSRDSGVAADGPATARPEKILAAGAGSVRHLSISRDGLHLAMAGLCLASHLWTIPMSGDRTAGPPAALTSNASGGRRVRRFRQAAANWRSGPAARAPARKSGRWIRRAVRPHRSPAAISTIRFFMQAHRGRHRPSAGLPRTPSIVGSPREDGSRFAAGNHAARGAAA